MTRWYGTNCEIAEVGPLIGKVLDVRLEDRESSYWGGAYVRVEHALFTGMIFSNFDLEDGLPIFTFRDPFPVAVMLEFDESVQEQVDSELQRLSSVAELVPTHTVRRAQ